MGLGVLANAQSTKIKIADDLPAGIILKDHCSVVVESKRYPEQYKDMMDTHWTLVSSQSELRTVVFEALFSQNQFRLMEKISTTFGLSPKVMWGNIGDYCGYLYDLLSKQPSHYPQVKEDSEAIHSLVYAGVPLKRTYRTVKLEEIEPNHQARVRSSCCLWYQFSGDCKEACSTCPLITRSQRVTQLTS